MLRSWVRLPYSPLESSETFVFELFLFLDAAFRKPNRDAEDDGENRGVEKKRRATRAPKRGKSAAPDFAERAFGFRWENAKIRKIGTDAGRNARKKGLETAFEPLFSAKISRGF